MRNSTPYQMNNKQLSIKWKKNYSKIRMELKN